MRSHLLVATLALTSLNCTTAPRPKADVPVEVLATPVVPAPVQAAPFKEAPIIEAAPASCPITRVHFAFDEALLRSDDLVALEKIAHCLRRNAALQIVIEGNADERGTEEYNLALSSKRAANVERYLTDLGVSRAQLDSVSYGDERPLCTAHEEACWAQNRRVALKPQ